MSRSDRLSDLVVILRDGAVYKGADLAMRLGVSLRTLYRDMNTLAKSGLPVAGEPGAGYQITSAVTLPPLNLTKAELEALHIGLAAAGLVEDEALSKAAASLSQKIDGVLGEDARGSLGGGGYGFATYPFADTVKGVRYISVLRTSIRARQKCEIMLSDESAPRVLRPLALEYWGRVWTVSAWCESSDGFVTSRLDKIEALTLLNALFVDEPGKRLEDMPGD